MRKFNFFNQILLSIFDDSNLFLNLETKLY